MLCRNVDLRILDPTTFGSNAWRQIQQDAEVPPGCTLRSQLVTTELPLLAETAVDSGVATVLMENNTVLQLTGYPVFVRLSCQLDKLSEKKESQLSKCLCKITLWPSLCSISLISC